jgi:peptide/nickel transport system permease protein
MKFLLRRLALVFPILWGVVTLLFAIFSLLGDPSRMVAGQRVDTGTLESIRRELGLDKPLLVQYGLYLRDLSPIDYLTSEKLEDEAYWYYPLYKPSAEGAWVLKLPYLRRSYQNGKSVSLLYLEYLPATLLLSCSSLLLATFLAIPLGLAAAYYRFSWLDYVISIFSVIGVSAPSFFVAIFLLWFFAIYGHWWSGLNVSGYVISEDIFTTATIWRWENLILPTLALGVRPMAILFQLMRENASVVLTQDYIQAARAKGLSEKAVLARHVLPNALSPVLTALSGWFAALLSGSFFVEYIFGWPGIGKWTVDALFANDYPVALGSCIFTSILFMLINLFNDVLLARLDPRIELK